MGDRVIPDLNHLALDWANKKLTTKEMLEAAYAKGYMRGYARGSEDELEAMRRADD